MHIKEHYTDTAGFTDHVFALMHLIGFRFAPRIRDLADKRLYIHGDTKQYPTLAGMIGGTVNIKRLPHLSPLGWEHINLTGGYIWRQDESVEQGKFRPLRMHGET